MKILVLMPLDQQHVDMSAAIYKALPHEIKEHTFAMPMFMEYLISVGKSQNWLWAFFDAIVSDIALLISLSNSLLLVYRNTADFYMLILYPANLPILFIEYIRSNSFW